MGLLKAIDRFDPARGTAFSSFAVPTIAGELKRYFRDKCWSVRVPRDLQELAVRVDRATNRLVHELGHAPTAAEIAQDVGVSIVSIEQVLEAREAAAAYRAESLDRSCFDDDQDGTRVVDRLGGDDPGYRQAESSATVESMMSILSDREREILRLRFVKDLTQSEIGDRVGLSQMHISRLLRQAVARLREVAESSEEPAWLWTRPKVVQEPRRDPATGTAAWGNNRRNGAAINSPARGNQQQRGQRDRGQRQDGDRQSEERQRDDPNARGTASVPSTDPR
jgi:RNA polymerase sigma-B factor